MRYPTLPVISSTRQAVEVFGGYNHNLRIGDGEFYEMENMTSDYYPVLSPRKRRGECAQIEKPNGMFYDPSHGLFFVDGCNLYLLSGSNEPKKIDIELQDTPKHFAMMGVYLIIAPDMVWVDTSDTRASGSMGERWEVTEGEVKISLCRPSGDIYEDVGDVTISPDPPEAPGNKAMWIDTSSTPHVLKQYTASTEEWTSIATTYLKISGLGNHYFERYDGVTISGLGEDNTQAAELNGSHVIQQQGHGEIVIIGILDEVWTQACTAEAPVIIERKVPQLDFIVESGNRLWGVIHGKNEIYCSKLGDFKNWECYMGLATDSWVGNVGSPGDWTGAVNHGGYPVFYKEDMKHKVWPSTSGAHQITSTPCIGPQGGSENSLAVLNGVLYYKSRHSICVDDGSGPVEISDIFGGEIYKKAVAAAHRSKYYIAMTDSNNRRCLFVYDINRQLWHREDNAWFLGFASTGDRLYGAVEQGYLLDMEGNSGTPEEDAFSWMVETGDLGLSLPEQKFISRLTVRMALDIGSQVSFYVAYDGEDTWVKLGTVHGTSLRSFTLPVRPRRCDHLRLRIRGIGPAKIYSITKTLEKGSDWT